MNEELKKDMQNIIINIENLLNYVEDTNQSNEQFVLDFLDRLNELSVKF